MKKKRIWIALGIAAVLGLTGCGAESKYSSADTSMAESNEYSLAEEPAAMQEMQESYDMSSEAVAGGSYDMPSEAAAAEEGSMDAGAGEVMDAYGIDNAAATNQKLIKTVDLSMETKEFDTLLTGITAKVQERGGYVESSEINNGSYYNGQERRHAWLMLRIPADQLEGFVTIVGEMGNVTWKNEHVQDVTLEYVDVESHKKALAIEQERLMALLENAENMEDIIQIESRLSEVRYELQSYESRLRTMDNQVNYSTVSINISEVERITEVKEKTFLEEISYRLRNNFYNIGQGVRGFAIWFLSSLPYLVIWAVVIFFVVWLIRRILRRKKDWIPRKEKKGRGKASAEETPKDGNPPA